MNVEGSIRTGHSRAGDAATAVGELHAQVFQPGMAQVVFFASPRYDIDALAAELNRRFPGVPLLGCTTAGEIGPAGYGEASLSGMSLPAACFVVETGRIDGLASFAAEAGSNLAADLLFRLQARSEGLCGRGIFGLLLIDGLSQREEPVAMAVQEGLGGVRVIGGSAGDDLRFQRTWVFHDGRFHHDSAVLLLAATSLPFRTVRHQHFVADDERLVVTEVDAAQRVVREINGRPAVVEYARLVGVDPAALTPEHFAASPVVVRIDGSEFVRSIQHVNADGSLTFYCAIEEGVVLRVAHGERLLEKLQATLGALQAELGEIEGMLVCDCILRNLEMTRSGLKTAASELFRRHRAVGFSTYGEQYDGVHVNQTLTGIAFGRGGAGHD